MAEQEWDENIDGRVVFIRRIESSYGFGSMKVKIFVDGKTFTIAVDIKRGE